MLRILIADDSVEGAHALARLLSISGYETRIAFDGEHALQVAEEFRPEIALLDIRMPIVSGLEACSELKRRLKGDLMAVFAISGWAAPEDVDLAMKMGFDHFFAKPVSYKDLEGAIRAYVSKGV